MSAPDPELHYRPAAASDASYINDLTRRTMLAYVAKTWASAADIETYFAKNLFDAAIPTWILLLGPQTAGRLSALRTTTSSGVPFLLLDNLHVEPRFQGKGLGRRAIEALVFEAARREGLPVCLLVLKVNPAKALYEKLGFVVVGESRTRFSMGWQVPDGFVWQGD